MSSEYDDDKHDEHRNNAREGAESLRQSASRIWLAGLGALARAQEEGGKAFDTLVQEGQAWQRRTQSAAGERFSEASQRMSGVAAGLSGRASTQWERFEARMEESLSRGLARLGVPTREEMEALHARIDRLEDALDEAHERIDEFERAAGPGSASGRAAARAGRRGRHENQQGPDPLGGESYREPD